MIETVPKIAEIKTLKELSKVLIIPLLVTAYLSESDFSIFGFSVDIAASFGTQVFQFFLIFTLSVIAVGSCAWAIHEVLMYFHFMTHETGLKVLSVVAVSYGFLGLFGENIPLISELSHLWFYTALVCGFYFLARASDVEQMFL